jgi:LacI family transcriptional regulator
VILQDEAGARVAVEHLVELGHRAIGLINGSQETATARRRLTGFTAAMEDAGLAPTAVTSLGYEPEQGRAALRQMMAHPQRPTAVVVANVNAALGALLEARTLGIRVPEELSIVTIHDAWTAATTWPPLTTVRMPLYELGRLAMTALFENLTDGVVDDRMVTDPAPQLVLRESTAAPMRH